MKVLFLRFPEGGEWCESSKFAFCTVINHSFYPIGLAALSGLAYFIHDWRILQLTLYGPLLIVLPVLFRSVPPPDTESHVYIVPVSNK